MRITKSLKGDQEILKRYLDVLGGGSVALSNNKLAQPGFFISAHRFIQEYIEEGFFKKEELLIKALEGGGFPSDEGPVAVMKSDQLKCHEAAGQMIAAAKLWHAGDEIARSEMGWAISEFTNTLRQHLEKVRNLIIPLIEQSFSIDEEQKIGEEVNAVFKTVTKSEQEKSIQQVEALEEELSDWR